MLSVHCSDETWPTKVTFPPPGCGCDVTDLPGCHAIFKNKLLDTKKTQYFHIILTFCVVTIMWPYIFSVFKKCY